MTTAAEDMTATPQEHSPDRWMEHPAIAIAAGLLPLIEAHRDQGEADGRLAPEVVQAAGKAGMFRLFAPREVGGLEVSLPVAATVFELLAGVDPAVTWYMGNSLPSCIWAAQLGPAEWSELFAEPDRNFGLSAAFGGKATWDGSGFRLSGDWPLVTGVLDARWCALMGQVWEGDGPALVDGQPDMRLFYVPTDALTVDPIWDDAVAMRATGSHRVTVDDVELPGWCAQPAFPPAGIDRPLFRLGMRISGSTANGSMATGILRSAVDAAAGELREKVSTISGIVASEDAALLEMLSEADMAHRTLRGGMRVAASELWASASETGRGTPEQRTALYGMPFYTAGVARRVISQLYGRSSRAAFFRGHALERALRNIHAVHYAFEPLRRMQHASTRVRMGLPPGGPPGY